MYTIRSCLFSIFITISEDPIPMKPIGQVYGERVLKVNKNTSYICYVYILVDIPSYALVISVTRFSITFCCLCSTLKITRELLEERSYALSTNMEPWFTEVQSKFEVAVISIIQSTKFTINLGHEIKFISNAFDTSVSVIKRP